MLTPAMLDISPEDREQLLTLIEMYKGEKTEIQPLKLSFDTEEGLKW